MAIDLARNHNVRDTEHLLVKYANTLLEKNKTFSAIELYRKANHQVDAAKLLFQVCIFTDGPGGVVPFSDSRSQAPKLKMIK